MQQDLVQNEKADCWVEPPNDCKENTKYGVDGCMEFQTTQDM